jgi:hypothetical protein
MSFFQAVEQVNIAVSPRADLQIGLGKPSSSFFGKNRTANKFLSFFGLKALLFFLWQKPESPKAHKFLFWKKQKSPKVPSLAETRKPKSHLWRKIAKPPSPLWLLPESSKVPFWAEI